MTNAPATSRLALISAVLAGLVLFAPVPHARAEFDGRAPTTGTKAPVPGPTVTVRDHRDRVVRDHRGKDRKRPPPRRDTICAGWAC